MTQTLKLQLEFTLLLSSNHFTVTIRGSNTEGSKKRSEPVTRDSKQWKTEQLEFCLPIMKSTFSLSFSKLVVVIPQERPITFKHWC